MRLEGFVDEGESYVDALGDYKEIQFEYLERIVEDCVNEYTDDWSYVVQTGLFSRQTGERTEYIYKYFVHVTTNSVERGGYRELIPNELVKIERDTLKKLKERISPWITFPGQNEYTSILEIDCYYQILVNTGSGKALADVDEEIVVMIRFEIVDAHGRGRRT